MQLAEIDSNFANSRINLPYPHVRVLSVSDALSIVIPCLPTGDLSVICEYNSIMHRIASVSDSPHVLEKLVRISAIEVCKSESEKYMITERGQLLDIGKILVE